ncbi:hypothetical protein M9H77_04305 [Catharanthus roseus]|uniref:Uncharacterized protein n=1 Tax=Catharanthus roseus TaxID=4058 RepID=A0ACC0CDQ7_CATRO|nr:hypothetical protein M9H77_04305 [Catharanthus roseus]
MSSCLLKDEEILWQYCHAGESRREVRALELDKEFNKVPFWIQIGGLPAKCYTKEVGRKLARRFSECLDIQIRERTDDEGGSYFDVQGKDNIKKTLRQGIKVLSPYTWGYMGCSQHCSLAPEDLSEEEGEIFGYGEWMQTSIENSILIASFSPRVDMNWEARQDARVLSPIPPKQTPIGCITSEDLHKKIIWQWRWVWSNWETTLATAPLSPPPLEKIVDFFLQNSTVPIENGLDTMSPDASSLWDIQSGGYETRNILPPVAASHRRTTIKLGAVPDLGEEKGSNRSRRELAQGTGGDRWRHGQTPLQSGKEDRRWTCSEMTCSLGKKIAAGRSTVTGRAAGRVQAVAGRAVTGLARGAFPALTVDQWSTLLTALKNSNNTQFEKLSGMENL